MKHILILLLMLAAFPGQADNAPVDGDSQAPDSAPKSEDDNNNQAEGSASKSDKAKKPKQGDEEEEPDCD